jgi:hypothetical protein
MDHQTKQPTRKIPEAGDRPSLAAGAPSLREGRAAAAETMYDKHAQTGYGSAVTSRMKENEHKLPPVGRGRQRPPQPGQT